ncbi:hypothetical protein [Pseudoalteromonas spongiae]|uniref:Uncharacterized protein n=1 Tax=Pseudoalteromonas spongiae TaxID=298657 RepID=A0ABU8ESQ1_9GAMM
MSQNQFIRKYKRISKSKWSSQDKSTILLLADVTGTAENEVAFGFSKYIYLHRDDVGKVLGISISKSIFDSYSTQFEDRYLEDEDMLTVMLIYIDEIIEFCELFTDDFESVFMLSPRVYFEAAIAQWCEKIEKT